MAALSLVIFILSVLQWLSCNYCLVMYCPDRLSRIAATLFWLGCHVETSGEIE
jgi:hypothetical protein